MVKKAIPKKVRVEERRNYISQSDIPAHGLKDALRVGRAIADNYGKNPTKPLRVAQAMEILPGSSRFRMLCGASIAYGITDGGYNSENISLTPLGRRIVAPTIENDDFSAMREAFLRPRLVREFLTRYNGSRLPSESIAKNVLDEMGVPEVRAAEVFALISESARELGFVREVKGQAYVDLDSASLALPQIRPDTESETPSGEQENETKKSTEPQQEVPVQLTPNAGGVVAELALKARGRVFITHGRNREIVTQLKDLLTFGGFTPIVAVEQESVSKPVPDKVMDDMRSCGAAIIHVGAELKLLDSEGKEHKMLNQNVLIEIGAAMALYGRKFILLVEQGVTLPSNLQGLYEVRYIGEMLDYDSTMKLLKAFNDFRS